MIRVNKIDLLNGIIVATLAVFLVLDLFIHAGEPTTFDGRIHITNIAQYTQAVRDGEFPVRWADGLANYGMPMPILAQQTTNYLGVLLMFLIHNALLTDKLLFLVGSILASIFLYWFLRLHFQLLPAFLGTFLFTFAPYRIFDIYVRGDLPEFFASVFIILVLIGLYYTVKTQKITAWLLLTIAVALLSYTHPPSLLISMFIIIPYATLLLLTSKQKRMHLLQIVSAFFLGVGLSALYVVPLLSEMKYFYYGLTPNHLVPNQFLGLTNFLGPGWYYFYKDSPFLRGNFISAGLLETIIILVGLCFSIILYETKHRVDKLLAFSLCSSVLVIFMLTAMSSILYEKVNLLNSLQFPWRMLIDLNIFVPIVFAVVLSYVKKYQYILCLLLIVLIAYSRFPQIYGKNYVEHSEQYYTFTKENLYAVIFNTIWSGKSTDYAVEKNKPAVIEGKGLISEEHVLNASRLYTVNAQTPLRMVDYTFYFPGWRVFIDGNSVPIQFQDPRYRGVITYNVPSGLHHIFIQFGDTKDRLVGIFISAGSLLAIIGLFLVFFIIKKKKSITNN